MALGPLAPIDRVTLAYVAVALGFTLARGPRTWPASLLLPLGLVLTGVIAALLAPPARRGGAAGRFLAEFYPMLLMTGFYTEIGQVNLAAGVVYDALVQRWEETLFGTQVSLAWIRSWPSPSWSTLMHAAYLAYYFVLAGSSLSLWCSGRRAAARSTVLAIMGTFYLCYVSFLSFPVVGPRYLFPMAENAATGVPLAVFANRFLETGSAWGTAFPSSHVAAALVAAVCAWQGWRPLGRVLVPVSVLLAFSTVYCQFHYAVDALAGTLLAGLVLLAFGCRAREA